MEKGGRLASISQALHLVEHLRFEAFRSRKAGVCEVAMSTTYVFGAGASLHAGYPLVSTMGSLWLDFMLRIPIRQFESDAQFLIDTFGKAPNAEDVITAIQSRVKELENIGTAESESERTVLGNCRGRLTSALREWFRDIHTKAAPAYAEFATNIIQPGDVVITFNYDDSLERELRRVGKWDISRGYGFQLGAEEIRSQVLVLKLHGSMNWLIPIFGGAGGPTQVGGWPPSALGEIPAIHRADLQYLGYTDFTGNIYTGGGVLECLILPGRAKEFFFDTSFGREFSGFWKLLWSQAASALKNSEKIVLCGYSLLPVDKDAREMLLRTPKEETQITIVSGSQSERIAGDFRAAGLQHVQVFAGGHFEEWVKAEVNKRNGRASRASSLVEHSQASRIL